MSLLLDTDVLVRAERAAFDILDLLVAIRSETNEARLAISVITLMELAHGQQRADYQRIADDRGLFISDISTSVSVFEVDGEIAIRAGKLDGLLEMNGLTVGFPDLLIAATALEHGFGVLTYNTKDFLPVRGLRVVDAAVLSLPTIS